MLSHRLMGHHIQLQLQDDGPELEVGTCISPFRLPIIQQHHSAPILQVSTVFGVGVLLQKKTETTCCDLMSPSSAGHMGCFQKRLNWHELVPLSSHYLPEDLQVSHLVITTTSLSPRILAVLDNLLSALAEVALHMPHCVVHELQLHIILNNDCMHARVLSGCKSAGG